MAGVELDNLLVAMQDEAPADRQTMEPGVILVGRLCIVGTPELRDGAWRAVVTDLSRERGVAPHHRLLLEYLPIEGHTPSAFLRAASIDGAPFHGWSASAQGVWLLSDFTPIPVLDDRGGRQRALELTAVLASELARLHTAGFTGVDLSRADLRQGADGVLITGHTHLMGTGTASDDLTRLVALLARRAPAPLSDLLSPMPRSAKALASRARAALARHTAGGPSPLPAIAPFIGRQRLLDAVLDATDAQAVNGAIALVGASGAGRSRLLVQLAREVERWTDAVFLAVTSGPETSGGLEDWAQATRGLAQRLEDEGLPTDPLPLTWTSALQVVDWIEQSLPTDRPLVVFYDDVEEASDIAVAVVHHLLGGPHVTVAVLACRDAIPAGIRDMVITTLHVAPLQVGEVRELLEASLPGGVEQAHAVAERLTNGTCALPGCLWATLQQWVETGKLAREGTTGSWRLEGEAPVSPPALPVPVEPPSPVSTGATDVARVMEQIRPVIRGLLPASVQLEMQVTDGAIAPCSATQLELLVVDLLLSGREALREPGGLLHLGVRPVAIEGCHSGGCEGDVVEDHLLVELQVVPHRGSPSFSSFDGCCEMAADIGGFLDLGTPEEDLLVVSAYLRLPLHADARASRVGPHVDVMVLHPDLPVRLTIESALSDLGLVAEGASPELRPLDPSHPCAVVFADPGTAALLEASEATATIVTVVDRRGRASETGPVLHVPFSIDALRAVLDSIRDQRAVG